VLRRSDSDKGGDSGFLLELLRDSQVKGLVSFRDIAGGGFSFSGTCGGGGGGGNLTGAMVPERPCRAEAELVESRESRGGRVGNRPGVFIPSVQRQLGTGSRRKGMGVPSVNDTSSMSEVTEMRCAVSKGDFARGASSVEASSVGVSVVSVASFVSFMSAVSAVSATSDVASRWGSGSSDLAVSSLALSETTGTSGAGSSVGDSDSGRGRESWGGDRVDSRLPMRERARDCGRSVAVSGRGAMSEASSKLSWSGRVRLAAA
jgi:hypothetical protein